MPNGEDRDWIRLCVALYGFRNKHGRWPTQVRLDQMALDNFRDHFFSPKRWARITSKIRFVTDAKGGFVAEDDGASFVYGAPTGDTDFELVRAWVGEPDWPWDAPRFTEKAAFTVDGAPFDYRGGPTNWREHCRDVAATHFGAARLRHLECDVKIYARFYVKPRKQQRRDLDRMIKTLVDGLGGAGLFKPTRGGGKKTPWSTNDHWICGVDAERHIDDARPRVEIEVWVAEHRTS